MVAVLEVNRINSPLLQHVNLCRLVRFALGIPVLAVVLISCAPKPTTPTVQAIVDSFFSGYAFLDVNGNGDLDSEDTPVENAAFIVTLQFGGEVGAFTDETGYAFIVAPGGVDYPVTMRMEPPQDSALKLIGPSEIIHELTDESPKFLFSLK